MKKIIKSTIKRSINTFVSFLEKTSPGRYFFGQIVLNAMSRTQSIAHKGFHLKFVVPNTLNRYRANTFSTKEPETLKWIDGIPRNAVVWDIGANVGLYSCYAAKARQCKVFAFEPSVFNLELLARNIFINDLTDLVTIIPLPLFEGVSVGKLNMTSTDWGGALSTFGAAIGFDGKPLDKTFDFSTVGMSMNEAAALFKIPMPDYIKMDVDGIEHLILKGGDIVLRNAAGVLVEINDDFKKQADDTKQYLTDAGLQLVEKRRWEGAKGTPMESTYNQIWRRKGLG